MILGKKADTGWFWSDKTHLCAFLRQKVITFVTFYYSLKAASSAKNVWYDWVPFSIFMLESSDEPIKYEREARLVTVDLPFTKTC